MNGSNTYRATWTGRDRYYTGALAEQARRDERARALRLGAALVYDHEGAVLLFKNIPHGEARSAARRYPLVAHALSLLAPRR